MSGARTAKHHDNVLCYSGFFVAQCSFTSIAPRPPCSCFSFGRGKSIRQVGFQVKQPSTALIQQIKRHQATSSDVKRRKATSSNVKRRQATSSDATGQIRQIRQIRQVRQVRHHSGGLFVVRLWTRRLQRCVEVLDAMQVPAWLRNPFCAAVCLCPFLLLT